MIMKNNDNGDNKDKKGDNEMKGIDNKYHQETLTVNNDNVDDKCAKGNNINEKIDVIENISNNKTVDSSDDKKKVLTYLLMLHSVR